MYDKIHSFIHAKYAVYIVDGEAGGLGAWANIFYEKHAVYSESQIIFCWPNVYIHLKVEWKISSLLFFNFFKI